MYTSFFHKFQVIAVTFITKHCPVQKQKIKCLPSFHLWAYQSVSVELFSTSL